MKKFKVLSIDAWNDGENSWTWNNWFTINTFDENEIGWLNEVSALKFFYNELSAISFERFKELYEIDDDQYNYVLVKKENFMPLFAIEYGSQV